MNKNQLRYNSILGGTYSLFGKLQDTGNYYATISNIVDECLKYINSEEELLRILRSLSKSKKLTLSHDEHYMNELEELLQEINRNDLREYTPKVIEFRKGKYFSKLFKENIYFTEFQYHIFMLEIELTNRLNKGLFINAELKIALLPHCLRININECKAKVNQLDYKCIYCSEQCYINYISKFLRKMNITPYIWMNINLKKLIKSFKDEKKKAGILGMACIPEIGIPLNANRCARWMGDFYENSIDLEYLEKLILI